MVQSVERAIDILIYVLAKNPGASLSDIGQDLGLSRSTVHRLLSCLQSKEVIEKDSAKRYRTGAVLFQLSNSSSHRGALVSLVLPFLQQLRDETGETINFHILVGRHHVCIEQAESPHELRQTSVIGKPIPLGPGATAKAILAYLPQSDQAAAIGSLDKHGLRQLDPEDFRKELSRIRVQGVAFSVEERVRAAAAASAPVFNKDGGVLGALTLSGPAQRLPAQTLRAYGQRLREVAARISSELGYRPSDGQSPSS